MKPKNQLYTEAVERSKKHISKWANALVKEGGLHHLPPNNRLPALKFKLGIRADDTSIDSDLNAALNKAGES